MTEYNCPIAILFLIFFIACPKLLFFINLCFSCRGDVMFLVSKQSGLQFNLDENILFCFVIMVFFLSLCEMNYRIP